MGNATQVDRLDGLDKHFSLPKTNRVPWFSPFSWLIRGGKDFLMSPVTSLAYGLLFSYGAFVILAYTADHAHLFSVSFAFFFLMGPLAVAGLLETARLHQRGELGTLRNSIRGVRRHGGTIAYFGLFLSLMAISWERISAITFALLYRGAVPDIESFVSDVLLSGDYTRFLAAYGLVALVFFGTIFSMMAFALPAAIHRQLDNITASMTSFRGVTSNPGAALVWAALIFGLMLLGTLTYTLGLIVVVPVLGYASWYAYNDVVGGAEPD